jgi:hypothetical protein
VRGEVAPTRARFQLDRAQQRPPRDDERAAPERAPPGFLQRFRGRSRELARDRAVELREQRGRLVEVVRADLGELVAGALADPGGERSVLLRALRLAHPAVRDVADEHVLEAEGEIARDARALFRDDELALEQAVEHPLDLVGRRCSAASARTARREAISRRPRARRPLTCSSITRACYAATRVRHPTPRTRRSRASRSI